MDSYSSASSVDDASSDDSAIIVPIFTDAHFAFLKEHGYVVIPNVVSAAFCNEINEGILKFFAAWDPSLIPEYPSAWTAAASPAGTIHGINRLAAQTPFQWLVRQNFNIVCAFAEYWSKSLDQDFYTEDMVTSMDGFNFYLAEASKRIKPGYWPHTDQGLKLNKDGKEPLDGKCLQGFLNLKSCEGDNDGGLVVWDKSHRAWRGYFEKNPDVKTKDNWYKYPEEHIRQIEVDGRDYLQLDDPDQLNAPNPVPMQRIRVRAPAGSLVLWFSKTIHQNDAPQMRVPSLPLGQDRSVVYVCMAPKIYLTEKDIKNRKKAFEQNRMTSHWSCGGQVKLFPTSFRAYSTENAEVQKKAIARLKAHPYYKERPILSKLGKSVLGFSPSTQLTFDK